jgi:predicted  nucleic acid-binding Zn-ribbon protein
MFACQECGRKFRTVAAAERATNNGCPGCGGCDIDLAESDPISRAEHREYRADKAVIDSPDPYGYDTGR